MKYQRHLEIGTDLLGSSQSGIKLLVTTGRIITPKGEFKRVSEVVAIIERQGMYVGAFANIHWQCDGDVSLSQVKLCSEEDISAPSGLWFRAYH